MNTKYYYHKVVIITGGFFGVGLSLVKKLAAQNGHICLIARDTEKLEQARELLVQISGDNSIIQTNASDVCNRTELVKVIDYIGAQFGTIDLVINCAGTISCGRFADQKYEDLVNCLNTN